MYCVQNLSCAVSSPLMYVVVGLCVCVCVCACSVCVWRYKGPVTMYCLRAKVAVWKNMIDSCHGSFTVVTFFISFLLLSLFLPSLLSLDDFLSFSNQPHSWACFIRPCCFYVFLYARLPPRQSSKAVMFHISVFLQTVYLRPERITHSSLLLWPRLSSISPSLSITFHPITPTPALCAHAPVCLSTDYGAECLANCNLSANYNTSYVFFLPWKLTVFSNLFYVYFIQILQILRVDFSQGF